MKNASVARANHFFTLLLALIASTTILAFILIGLHGAIPRKPPTSTVDLIVEAYRGLVAPEATEQFVFALLSVIVPVVALAVACFKEPGPLARLANRLGPFLPPAVAVIFLGPVFGSDYVPTVVRDVLKSYAVVDTLAILASVLGAAVLCYWLIRPKDMYPHKAGMSALTAWIIFMTAVFLQMAAWRVVTFASVTPASPWDGHADPLFYVMAQVNAGRTLLADLPSQYGLFPEMLRPFFQVVGLTVGSVTLLFGALQVVSMAGLFFVLQRFVRSKVLLTICGVALVLLTFETVLLNANYEERYFQYWPLRFFWPAVSVAVFHWFSLRPSYPRAMLVSLLAAVATLWNLDSGLFVAVAFGAYLAARSILEGRKRAPRSDGWSAREHLFALAAHVLIVAGVAVAFLIALRLKAGQPLHLRWLIEYQKVFADLGLAMLPLPRTPHPWMSVLAIYLAGLLQAFYMWRGAGDRSPRADIIFYLSMLGLGLFVYYAGRSHILNLVTVCWPAAMLIAMYADEVMRRIRARALHPSAISIAIACTSMLLMPAASFVARLPSFVERTWHQTSTRGQLVDQLASEELAFIETHAPRGSQCLIVSLRQGIYYAQAQLSSPFIGPGIIETVLVADQQRMLDGIYTGAYACLIIGVGPKSTSTFKIDMEKVLSANTVIDKSAGATMLYLTPKAQ